jgi:hypothetical protein
VNRRDNVGDRITNDELARRLFQSPRAPAPPKSTPTPEAPRALASPPDSGESPQTWPLGNKQQAPSLEPVSERERLALFAALSKGTKANLGREPTVVDLVLLVEEIDRARILVSSARDAIQGRSNVYVDGSKITFGGSAQQPGRNVSAAKGLA